MPICVNCGREYNYGYSSATYGDQGRFCSRRCENIYNAREAAAENDRRQTEAAEAVAEYARRQAEAAEEEAEYARMQKEMLDQQYQASIQKSFKMIDSIIKAEEASAKREQKEHEERMKREERERMLAKCVKIKGSFYSQDETTLVECDKATANLVIPDGVTDIAEDAFKGCTILKRVTIPGSMKKISDRALQDCTSIESVTISDNVEEIGLAAFKNCTSLKEITIPDGVKTIGEDAFRGCTSIKSVELPDSLKTIVDGAFMECSSLASIKIPDGIKEIDANVFSNCTALSSVTIPKSVTEIGVSAFMDCTALKEVTIPAGVQTIRGKAFQNTGLTKITIPATVKLNSYKDKEGKYWGVFAKCESLKSAVIAEGKTALGTALFRGCTALTQVTLPDTLETINASAFRGCAALKKVSIPKSVTEICDNAFSDCKSLETVEVHGKPKLGKNLFTGCASLKGKAKALAAQTSSTPISRSKTANKVGLFNPFYLIKEKWRTILLTFLAWCVPAFLLWAAVLPVKVIVLGSLVIAIAQAWCDLHLEKFLRDVDSTYFSYLVGGYFSFLYSLRGTLLFLAKSGIVPASPLGALEWLGPGTMYVPLILLAVVLAAFRVLCAAKSILTFGYKTEAILSAFVFAVCAFYLLSVFFEPVVCVIITVAGFVAVIKILGEDWLQWMPLILGGVSLLLHTVMR